MILFSYENSLESPFRKILNNVLKHEEENFECPILSNACPFLHKQFIKRIVLGQHEQKEFMDEMMETVILDLDLNQPLEIKKPPFIGNKFNNILSSMTGIFLIINMIFVMNYSFGIGK